MAGINVYIMKISNINEKESPGDGTIPSNLDGSNISGVFFVI